MAKCEGGRSLLKLYLDSADLREVAEIAAWNVLSGITTNPSLLAKVGQTVEGFMARAADLVSGPISLEVMAEAAAAMVAEAKQLKKLGEQVVIKVPMTAEGLKAQKGMHAAGLKTNITLVFSANQALLAAAAGGDYVSPFMGRLDDNGAQGFQLIQEIKAIYREYGIKTKIIAASLRTAREVTDAALAGADIATVPYAIFQKMVGHPLTDLGIERFQQDWAAAQSK